MASRTWATASSGKAKRSVIGVVAGHYEDRFQPWEASVRRSWRGGVVEVGKGPVGILVEDHDPWPDWQGFQGRARTTRARPAHLV